MRKTLTFRSTYFTDRKPSALAKGSSQAASMEYIGQDMKSIKRYSGHKSGVRSISKENSLYKTYITFI